MQQKTPAPTSEQMETKDFGHALLQSALASRQGVGFGAWHWPNIPGSKMANNRRGNQIFIFTEIKMVGTSFKVVKN